MRETVKKKGTKHAAVEAWMCKAKIFTENVLLCEDDILAKIKGSWNNILILLGIQKIKKNMYSMKRIRGPWDV